MMKACVVLTAIAILTPAAHAQSRRDLERDIAALKAQVAQERPLVENLSLPWQKGSDLYFGFAAAPFIGIVKEINTLPPNQRTIDFAVIDHSGQLWGWDAGCAFGDESEYIEFADNNYRVQANA